jgi:hypothetical protein
MLVLRAVALTQGLNIEWLAGDSLDQKLTIAGSLHICKYSNEFPGVQSHPVEATSFSISSTGT